MRSRLGGISWAYIMENPCLVMQHSGVMEFMRELVDRCDVHESLLKCSMAGWYTLYTDDPPYNGEIHGRHCNFFALVKFL